MKAFIRALKYLKSAGFTLRLSYVTHPTVLHRMNEDMRYLRYLGFDARPKVYRGVFGGKQYPEDFSTDDRRVIKLYLGNSMDWEILSCKLRFVGKKCLAGHLFLKIDPDGTVYRCSSYQRSDLPSLGNLFKGTFRLLKKETLCKQEVCYSPYEGLMYVNGISIESGTEYGDRIIQMRTNIRSNLSR